MWKHAYHVNYSSKKKDNQKTLTFPFTYDVYDSSKSWGLGEKIFSSCFPGWLVAANESFKWEGTIILFSKSAVSHSNPNFQRSQIFKRHKPSNGHCKSSVELKALPLAPAGVIKCSSNLCLVLLLWSGWRGAQFPVSFLLKPTHKQWALCWLTSRQIFKYLILKDASSLKKVEVHSVPEEANKLFPIWCFLKQLWFLIALLSPSTRLKDWPSHMK